jgi:hypothetical protein
VHSAKHSLSPQSKRRGPPLAGYRPFNEAQIMSGWFNCCNIAAEQAECLLACIPECKEIAAKFGRVPDSAIHDILEKNKK